MLFCKRSYRNFEKKSLKVLENGVGLNRKIHNWNDNFRKLEVIFSKDRELAGMALELHTVLCKDSFK